MCFAKKLQGRLLRTFSPRSGGVGVGGLLLLSKKCSNYIIPRLLERKSFSKPFFPELAHIFLLFFQPSPFSAVGLLSTWPAYASGQAILKNRKPCFVPERKRYGNKEQAVLTVSKPQYLEQLESYLRKELQSLDLTKENAQELKLQPFREIFEFFIEDFKTYKPLLAAIKNEYEVTLVHMQEKIHSLEPLKALLVTVSDECTQQILELEEQERAEITTLKSERLYLLKLIDKMKEEKISLQTQVSKLRKSMAEEYLRYLNECDARKLLLADLSEMRSQQEDIMLHHVQDVKGEDTMKLALALKIARQDLTKVQVELNAMKADYGDVVPRRDFESQEKKYSDLRQKVIMHSLKDFDDLQKEYDMLLEIHGETVQERDQFYKELLQVQRSCTPRPDWDKCAEVISGGAERWDILAEGKTSEQLMDVLLEELGEGVLKEKDTFTGMGKNERVPVYLRFEGLVKNKMLNKKEVVAILREIWKEKVSADQQVCFFFLGFLQRKYGEASAFEWAYSIYENIKLYRSNDTMSLFYDILTGNVDEGIYHGQSQFIANLLKELMAYDSLNSGNLTSQFVALRAAFPLKNDVQIQELIEAAGYKAESSDELVNYRSLFNEDEEGKAEPFIWKLKSQYISEKQAYLRELKNELGDLL
uniref:Translin associated factor X interacting protein 1 n=1 Tax=Sphenodon punctatus TaxID=8508 RepID=A0A8D0GDJ3_SPHPU